MPLFLTTLREPCADHRIEPVEDGFLILPLSGREVQFDALARRVVEHIGPFAAFPRKGADGRFDSVHILPAVMMTAAECRKKAADALAQASEATSPEVRDLHTRTAQEWTALSITALAQERLERDLL
ncbi:MAG: hypothetical protein M3Q74_00630 [Pseudomonadota bacterium]|nr:hypothetical protein [Pseudomonadota bacterium]